MASRNLRGGVIGCGFWAETQIAAWGEVPGVEIAAVCDRNAERANAVAQKFGIPVAVTDWDALWREGLDFVDIITPPTAHEAPALAAARQGVDAIVQKPMAPEWDAAVRMADAARAAGTRLLVHENFRWQAPLRRVKALADAGEIGEPFKARLSFRSAFPVYDNQPSLATDARFILMDVGVHVFDVARFLLGEAASVACRTRRVNPAIRGEDVADTLMVMRSGAHCLIELSYATVLKQEAFPQTLAEIEGADGSILLSLGGEIVVTRRQGRDRTTWREIVTPPAYPWADPAYAVVHSSIVDCCRNLADGLRGGPAETTADDNLETLRLVFAAYDSAAQGQTISFPTP